MKFIKTHLNTHKFPNNIYDFGHYLAGLSEANGYLSSVYYQLTFHKADIQTAYKIKSFIGFGSIKPILNTQTYYYRVTHKLGLLKIVHLLNGKLRTPLWISSLSLFIPKDEILPVLNEHTYLLSNYWLSGLIDGIGSLDLKLLLIPNTSINLSLQLSHPLIDVLNYINLNLKGGYIDYNKELDLYEYETSDYLVAYNLIKYLDKYHLQSSKWRQYNIWRKVYIMVYNKEHLSKPGLDKIIKFKEKLSYSKRESALLRK